MIFLIIKNFFTVRSPTIVLVDVISTIKEKLLS